MHKVKLNSEWTSGDYGDFLGLTDEERQIVEMRISVSKMIRRLREENGMTQTELAQRAGSSQSRIARIEAGAADVTLDLLIRVMLAAGGKLADLGDLLKEAYKPATGEYPSGTLLGKRRAFPSARKNLGGRKTRRAEPASAK
jgi:transcriptional regulator with XRE-family HTH domain